MDDLARFTWNPAARYPLLVQLSGGRVRHYARQTRAGASSVVTPCRKGGAAVGDGAGLPFCAACARRPNPISQQATRWLPDATPGLCPHGESGPDGARACSLPEGHAGDHHLTRGTTTEETETQ